MRLLSIDTDSVTVVDGRACYTADVTFTVGVEEMKSGVIWILLSHVKKLDTGKSDYPPKESSLTVSHFHYTIDKKVAAKIVFAHPYDLYISC